MISKSVLTVQKDLKTLLRQYDGQKDAILAKK